MRFSAFEWDKSNIEHIARYQVIPEEVEEAFLGRNQIRKTRDDRYILLGQSTEGRYLTVIFIPKANKVRVITARDMDYKERRLFKQKEG